MSPMKTRLAGVLARAGYELRPTVDPSRLAKTHPDLEAEFAGVAAKCAPYSMTSIERMYALWQAVRHVVDAGVEGEIVECGVWRGGSSMLAAHALLDRESRDRTLWL